MLEKNVFMLISFLWLATAWMLRTVVAIRGPKAKLSFLIAGKMNMIY